MYDARSMINSKKDLVLKQSIPCEADFCGTMKRDEGKT